MATLFQYMSLSIVHLILALRAFLLAFGRKIFKPLILPYKRKTRSWAAIRRDAKALQKLPLHVGIVIVEDTLSYKDVANVIVWCVSMGISHISIYDNLGILKQNKHEIERNIQVQQKVLLGDDHSKLNVQIQVGKEKNCLDSENSQSSNYPSVYLISPADGKQSLVEMCKHLSREVSHDRYRVEDIEPSSVDALLQVRNPFPDPDLVIRFGATESLLGYLPWQLRLSEILSLPTHHDVDYHSLHQLFTCYGNTEQRFGR